MTALLDAGETIEHVDDPGHARIEAASALLHALGDDDLDEAQAQLDHLGVLTGLPREHPDLMLFQVLILIQRGRASDALQAVQALEGEAYLPLRMLCLFFNRDPLWQGLALELAEQAGDDGYRAALGAMALSMEED